MEAVITEQPAPERNVTLVPEDDVRQKTIGPLDLEKVLNLSLSPGRIDVTQDNGLECRVPQPLMRVAVLRGGYVGIRRLEPVRVTRAEVRLKEGKNALFEVILGQTIEARHQ